MMNSALSRRMLLLTMTALGGCAWSNGHLPTNTAEKGQDPFLRDIHRRAFAFFWETTNHETGLTPDRWPTKTFSSVAAIGFALTAYCIGAENAYISRSLAAERTRNTLRYLYNLPQGEAQTGVAGYKGYFYHFLTFEEGVRYKKCELSSIDTSLLLMGALFAAEYFDENAPLEQEIRALSKALYERVDWTFMMRPSGLQSMGWHPETGFIKAEWAGYNEAIMIYLLGLASPTHPMPKDAYTAWTKTYDNSFSAAFGAPHLSFSALFIHQYNHVWIDFRGLSDAYLRGKGIDYFENSRRATLGQRDYAIKNPLGFEDYGANIWGLSACDGPGDVKLERNGKSIQFHSYSARGSGANETIDDGTIAPTAAISSIVFTPDESLAAAKAMYAQYGDDIYGQYGFFDSFNPSFRTDYKSLDGHQTKSAGWVATDYLGIDQGPILAMIENRFSELIWRKMHNCGVIKRGLNLAGFSPMSGSGSWMVEG